MGRVQGAGERLGLFPERLPWKFGDLEEGEIEQNEDTYRRTGLLEESGVRGVVGVGKSGDCAIWG